MKSSELSVTLRGTQYDNGMMLEAVSARSRFTSQLMTSSARFDSRAHPLIVCSTLSIESARNNSTGWPDWRSNNGVRHINEVKLRRARLVLGLVTTFGGSTIPIFIHATQAHSARPSLRGLVQWEKTALLKLRLYGTLQISL